MSEFSLAFRFYACMEWVNKKRVNLEVRVIGDSSHVIFGVNGDERKFCDVNVFCLFVEGMMKMEEWDLEDRD